MKTFFLLLLLNFITFTAQSRTKSFLSSTKIRPQKSYMQGFGKKSKNTGQYKTKTVNGYYKKTNRGFKRIQSYARS